MKSFFTIQKFKKPFGFLLMLLGILSFHVVQGQQDAPITTIETVVTTSNSSAVVTVTAVNFNQINSFNLQFLYDHTIADATGVSFNIPGTVTTDLNTDGIIEIGWFNFGPVTVLDNSVIFSFEFDKVSNGTTPISVDPDYTLREWYSGFTQLNDLPLEDFYIPGSLTFQGHAPYTTAPDILACPGTQIDIPITVSYFNTIGSISLLCTFDPLVLTDFSFTNNSGYPSFFVLNPQPGIITVSGSDISPGGTTLPDDAILFTLHFTYQGGITDISWVDDGGQCLYSGPEPEFYHLPDTPQSTYYIDGSVSQNFITTWTGGMDTDWLKSDNWDCDVPTVNHDVFIGPGSKLDGSKMNHPVISTDVVVKTMTISPGVTLTIDPGATVEVTSTLNNLATSDHLVICSDASSTASLLHNNDNIKATIERYIPASDTKGDPVYHLVSVPLTQDANPLSGLFMWSYLYEFDASLQEWVALGTPTNTPLYVDQGYMIYKYPGPEKWQSDTTYTFEGPMNNGPFTCNVAYYNVGKNHNLVPNPYPSSIDWDAASGWAKTNLYDAIWIWNPSAGNYAAYGSEAETNGGSRYIAAGQSFFVSAKSANPGLAMNNDVRVHHSQPFLKGGDEVDDLLRLKAVANNFSDETVIRFREGATPNFDDDLEVTKFYGNADAPQIYSVTDDNELLSINSLPFTTDVINVPVGFELDVDGLVTIEASSIESFDPGVTIFLKDELTGDLIDLRQTQSYNFSHNPDNDPDRFKVIFNGTTTIIESSSTQTYCYLSGDQLMVRLPDGILLPVELNLFNVNGQLALRTEILSNKSTISVNGMVPGAYIVKAITRDRLYTQKIMIK